jgi:hypothetical protein
MVVNRLTVWLGKTMIDGDALRMSLNSGWQVITGDFYREAYEKLCQTLADQFEVPVDLAQAHTDRYNPGEGPVPIASFYPVERIPIPDWLKFGVNA